MGAAGTLGSYPKWNGRPGRILSSYMKGRNRRHKIAALTIPAPAGSSGGGRISSLSQVLLYCTCHHAAIEMGSRALGPSSSDGPSFHRGDQSQPLLPTSFFSRSQSVGITGPVRGEIALDRPPPLARPDCSSVAFGVVTGGKKELAFFGSGHDYRSFPRRQQSCAYSLGSWCSSCQLLSTARVNTGRCWLFPGCFEKLLTLGLKKNIFRD